jgi:hypothetical protein
MSSVVTRGKRAAKEKQDKLREKREGRGETVPSDVVLSDLIDPADSGQQISDRSQQTTDNRQQTAESRKQTADSRQQSANCK